jgi:hypothetical protein
MTTSSVAPRAETFISKQLPIASELAFDTPTADDEPACAPHRAALAMYAAREPVAKQPLDRSPREVQESNSLQSVVDNVLQWANSSVWAPDSNQDLGDLRDPFDGEYLNESQSIEHQYRMRQAIVMQVLLECDTTCLVMAQNDPVEVDVATQPNPANQANEGDALEGAPIERFDWPTLAQLAVIKKSHQVIRDLQREKQAVCSAQLEVFMRLVRGSYQRLLLAMPTHNSPAPLDAGWLRMMQEFGIPTPEVLGPTELYKTLGSHLLVLEHQLAESSLQCLQAELHLLRLEFYEASGEYVSQQADAIRNDFTGPCDETTSDEADYTRLGEAMKKPFSERWPQPFYGRGDE